MSTPQIVRSTVLFARAIPAGQTGNRVVGRGEGKAVEHLGCPGTLAKIPDFDRGDSAIQSGHSLESYRTWGGVNRFASVLCWEIKLIKDQANRWRTLILR